MKISSGRKPHGNSAARKIVMVAALIALASAAVYLPALENEFVDFDDDEYIVDNPYLRLPWSRFLGWMFTSYYAYNWHPLTWLSMKIDFSLWRLDPTGYHLTNLVFHGLNVFLLTICMGQMFRSRAVFSERGILFGAGLMGILFGVHPIHVESVAWATERKDVLYAFFWLTSIIFYLKYAVSETWARKAVYYGCSIGAFALSLMSKQMGVTLPVILILIDWYPLGRFVFREGRVKMVLIEKLPYFTLSIAASLLVIWAQGSGGTIVTEAFLTPWHRFWVSVRSILFYLEKTFVPVNLTPFYPLPEWLTLLNPVYPAALLLIIFVTALCIVLRKKAPVIAVAWAYFIVSLLPVIGIIKVGFILAADRYMYLPVLGPIALLGVGSAWAWDRLDSKKCTYLVGIAALVAIVLSAMTVKQIGVWKNSFAVRYRIEMYKPASSTRYAARAYSNIEAGRYEAAIEDLTRAISIDSGIQGKKMNLPEYHSNRGNAYFALGQYTKALEDYNAAISENPGDGMYHFNRALAHKKLGNLDKAILDYKETVSLKPDFAPAYNGMGTAYAVLGKYAEAIENFGKAISLSEDNGNYYYNRGRVYEVMGDTLRVLEDYRAAAQRGHQEARDFLRREGEQW